MSHFEKRLNEALDDIPEVPDEETMWDLEGYIGGLTKRDPTVEQMLLEDRSLRTSALIYAAKFFKYTGWPELEERIKDIPQDAVLYASFVIDGRFPAAEKAIASDPDAAYYYAVTVIGDRWPRGEEAIASDPETAVAYATNIVGPFPKGEHAIAADPWAAANYAIDVVGGRWPEGEKAIYSEPQTAQKYDEFLRRVGEK